MKQLAFIAVAAFAFGLFAFNVAHFAKIALLGQPADLKETWGERIASLMKFFFGQRKVMEEKRSYHHLLIYWGFLVLSIASLDMILTGLLGEWFNLGVILGDTIYYYVKLVIDVANAIVLGAISFAVIRRFIRPAFVPLNLDAMLILGAIALLVISHFGHHAAHMAAVGSYVGSNPVSALFGKLLGLHSGADPLVVNVSPDTGHLIGELFWWVHMGILLAFLNYLPFSKHIHVLGSGPNIFFRIRDRGHKSAIPKAKLFDDDADDPDAEPLFDNWGVGQIEAFSWKSLLDNYSCTECARCTTYCPAFATEKPLMPTSPPRLFGISRAMAPRTPTMSRVMSVSSTSSTVTVSTPPTVAELGGGAISWSAVRVLICRPALVATRSSQSWCSALPSQSTRPPRIHKASIRPVVRR